MQKHVKQIRNIIMNFGQTNSFFREGLYFAIDLDRISKKNGVSEETHSTNNKLHDRIYV